MQLSLKSQAIPYTLSPINTLKIPKKEVVNLVTPTSDNDDDDNATMSIEEEKGMEIVNDTSRSASSNGSISNGMSQRIRRMSLTQNNLNGNMNDNVIMNGDGKRNINNNRKKITPLKRKLTEIISPIPTPSNDDESPYQTPKKTKRRKLTHRRSSINRSLSQTPYFQRSMSLSQTPIIPHCHSQQSINNDNNKNECSSSNGSNGSIDHQSSSQNDTRIVQYHLIAFYNRFQENIEEIPLGKIGILFCTCSFPLRYFIFVCSDLFLFLFMLKRYKKW